MSMIGVGLDYQHATMTPSGQTYASAKAMKPTTVEAQ